MYNRILDLRIATPQIVINFCTFLEEHHYFEESFKVSLRGNPFEGGRVEKNESFFERPVRVFFFLLQTLRHLYAVILIVSEVERLIYFYLFVCFSDL